MYKVREEYKAFKFSGLIGKALVQKQFGQFDASELKAFAEASPAEAAVYLEETTPPVVKDK